MVSLLGLGVGTLAFGWGDASVVASLQADAGDEFDDHQLRDEFSSKAPAAWEKLRQDRFADRSERRKSTFKYKIKDADDWKTGQSTLMEYSSGELKYFHDQTQDGDYAYGANLDHCFRVNKNSANDWKLLRRQALTQPIQVAPLAEDGSVQSEVTQRVIRAISADLESRFSKPLRALRLDRQSVSRFWKQNSDAFKTFSQRNDSVLGRVVTVKIELLQPFENEGRNPMEDGQWTKTGEVKFLADHDWRILEYELKSRSMTNDGKVLADRLEKFVSTYSSDGDLVSTEYSEAPAAEGKGSSVFEKTEHFKLTEAEIRECREKCFLSGFGLREPVNE